jgi:glyoxylase-like metal-dependent hydrolase (beta-lactamase superfamily II)
MTAQVESAGWRATLVEVGTLPMEGSWLAPDGSLPDRVDVPSNVLVLEGHGRTILVDTAAGELTDRWEGAESGLTAALDAAGIDPARIDTVVLTHLDFDHAGGIATAGRPAFPGARVVVSRAAATWADGADEAPARAVRLVAAAGLLTVAEAGENVAPGVLLVDAPGHRVGHSILRFGGAAFLADVVHHPSHVARPELDREFDSHVDAALETRRVVLAEEAAAGRLVACSHIAGWGRIEPVGDGLRWQTV